MSEKEIDAMVYNKHLEIIKGVVAPAIMTENYLQAYREGIKDTIQKMMKKAIDTKVVDDSFGQQVGEVPTIRYDVQPEDNLKIGDKVKLIIINEDKL